jgi:hypothetical protein
MGYTSDPIQYYCSGCGILYTPSYQFDYDKSVFPWNNPVAEGGDGWKDAAIAELSEALRLTAEYYQAPAEKGWSWFDALWKWSPGSLRAFPTPPWCCFISCEEEATVQIDIAEPYAETHSCDEHIGALLPPGPEGSDTLYTEWTLTRLN